MIERQSQSNAFVLRIWWEESGPPIWRGWVQHAATGETRYIQHLSDLLAFVETYTGPLAAVPVTEAESGGKAVLFNDQ